MSFSHGPLHESENWARRLVESDDTKFSASTTRAMRWRFALAIVPLVTIVVLAVVFGR